MNRERIRHLEDEYLAEHPGTEGTVQPFTYRSAEDVDCENLPFPIITDKLLAEGWEEAETWFVDSSGFGREGEPALTQGAFVERLRAYIRLQPEHGFGISSVGQFQVYVSAYRRTTPDTAPCLRCGGHGRVMDTEEPFAQADGMMPCPTCEGDGINLGD